MGSDWNAGQKETPPAIENVTAILRAPYISPYSATKTKGVRER